MVRASACGAEGYGFNPRKPPQKCMKNINNKNNTNKTLRLAVQKGGRLTDDTLDLLRKAGLDFESYKQKLFSKCRNFPLEILYVRDDDIPNYVATGTADIGIIGQNALYEERPKVKKLLNLRYGFCSLVVGVPKESNITELKDLEGKTIATSYPNSTKRFFKKNNIEVKTVQISGSVEIAPTLGIADAIADLMSTGSTLALNDLKPLTKIYDTEAVLIANEASFKQQDKNKLIEQLMTRLTGVLSAKNYKYLVINTPESIAPKLRKVIFGRKFTTSLFNIKDGICSVQTVVKEDMLWQTVAKLKNIGVTKIIVLPVEKIVL